MLTKDWYPIDASLSSSRESTRKTVESIISREKRQDIKQDKENKGRILINFNEKKINVDKIIYLLSNKKIMYSKFTRTIGYNGDIFEFFKLYSS